MLRFKNIETVDLISSKWENKIINRPTELEEGKEGEEL
jgi:hypothetical protein